MTTIETPIKCYFCNQNHVCRDCPKESVISSLLKKKVGNTMEYWFANNFNCLECNSDSLIVMGNHTPSLDIICKTCYNKFEIKSKCLSINELPKDIQLNHGSYIDYCNKLKKGLNLVVIIYGVNRINKEIIIREVLYANNIVLKNQQIINVFKKKTSQLSTIFIKDRNKLQKYIIKKNNILSFKEDCMIDV